MFGEYFHNLKTTDKERKRGERNETSETSIRGDMPFDFSQLQQKLEEDLDDTVKREKGGSIDTKSKVETETSKSGTFPPMTDSESISGVNKGQEQDDVKDREEGKEGTFF